MSETTYDPFNPNFDVPVLELEDGETCPFCEVEAHDNVCGCPMFDNNGIVIEVENITFEPEDTRQADTQ